MKRPVCFLDLDGVLVNFTHGVAQAHGRENPYDDPANWGKYNIETLWGMAPAEFWSPLSSVDFWENLEPSAECFPLIQLCEALFGVENVAILTSPSRDPSSVAGKAMWVAHHLPGYARRTFIGAKKELCAHRGAVLIDDSDYKIERFRSYGGNGILFPRPWNSNHAYSHFNMLYTKRFLELLLRPRNEISEGDYQIATEKIRQWSSEFAKITDPHETEQRTAAFIERYRGALEGLGSE